MARRQRKTAQPTRYFVVSSATAEAGSGLDADGHPVTAVVKLNLIGRWSHGQAQAIPVLFEAALGTELAALIERVSSASTPAEATTNDDI